ncbi:MAG: branched-chain amino acid ABC transporter permease [Acidimicrobiales bacterium]
MMLLAASVIAKVPGIDSGFFRLAFFLKLVSNGLVNGAVYALMALTVVIIYRTTSHLNFAQGEMATFGAFIVFALAIQQGIPYVFAIIIAMVISMVAGAGFERFLVRPVEKRSALGVVIVTLGLFLTLNAFTAAIWGTESVDVLKPFPGGLGDKFTFMDGPPQFFVTYKAVGIWITLAVLVIALWWLLQHTKLGLAYRAVASNRESSLAVGIPVGRMLMLGWAISAGIGTLAAVLISEQSNNLDFNLMGVVLLYGFAAAALGGFDSIVGAVVGGMIVGLVEALVPQLFTFIGSELSLAMALAIIVIVLLVRPQGIFGTKRIERV